MIPQPLLCCEMRTVRNTARAAWQTSSEASMWLHPSLPHTVEVQALLSSCSVKSVDTCLERAGTTCRHMAAAADGGWKTQLCTVMQEQHQSTLENWLRRFSWPGGIQLSSALGHVQVSRLCAVPLVVLLDIRITWHAFKGRKWPRQSWRIWEETLL